MQTTRDNGSSPLTRGKPEGDSRAKDEDRLIPAHAGKTRSGQSGSARRQAHPRSRGENCYGATIAACFIGSSPLTRGKQTLPAVVAGLGRLIPAHAGKTRGGRAERPHHQAHPRSRGENLRAQDGPAHYQGSSPLTQGKLRGGLARRGRGRLIPAHAGKTRLHANSQVRATAHPRSRGENPMEPSRLVKPNGSSPLTRGKPAMTVTRNTRIRLIPAHAGKTG